MPKPFVQLTFANGGEVLSIVSDVSSMTGLDMEFEDAKMLRDELSHAIDSYQEWLEETGAQDGDG